MLRVLITDSSRPIAERVAKQLSGDFLVEICCDGRSVLRKVRSFEPDIVLLDMMLPLLDGASILHTLRTSGFAGEIVIVSANQDLFTRALMEKYGITTPISAGNMEKYGKLQKLFFQCLNHPKLKRK